MCACRVLKKLPEKKKSVLAAAVCVSAFSPSQKGNAGCQRGRQTAGKMAGITCLAKVGMRTEALNKPLSRETLSQKVDLRKRRCAGLLPLCLSLSTLNSRQKTTSGLGCPFSRTTRMRACRHVHGQGAQQLARVCARNSWEERVGTGRECSPCSLAERQGASRN